MPVLVNDTRSSERRKGYFGHLEFKGKKQDSEPTAAAFEFTVTKNFALDRGAFRSRWGEGNDVDDFTWDALMYWDEVRITFNWTTPPHIVGTATAETRRVLGASTEQLSTPEWDPAKWTLRVKNVAPGRQYTFKWHLTEHAGNSQKIPVAAPEPT